MNRRAFIGGISAFAATSTTAIASVRCGPWMNMVRSCEVGVRVPGRTASQRCPNWCWAACIEAIFAIHGYDVEQEKIVDRLFGSTVCAPAPGPGIVRAVEGDWEDNDGNSFSATTEVLWDTQYFFARPDAIEQAANELANGNPLIIGALGHATVVTAMTYMLAANGAYQISSITVRDPWPGNSNRRLLSPQEALASQFLAKVVVY